MTAHDILLASLDYKQVLKRVGITLTEPTERALNGQTEYLVALAQIRDGQPEERR